MMAFLWPRWIWTNVDKSKTGGVSRSVAKPHITSEQLIKKLKLPSLITSWATQLNFIPLPLWIQLYCTNQVIICCTCNLLFPLPSCFQHTHYLGPSVSYTLIFEKTRKTCHSYICKRSPLRFQKVEVSSILANYVLGNINKCDQ